MGEVVNLWVKRKERERRTVHMVPGEQLECACGCVRMFIYRVNGETVVLCWDCDNRVMTFWDT